MQGFPAAAAPCVEIALFERRIQGQCSATGEGPERWVADDHVEAAGVTGSLVEQSVGGDQMSQQSFGRLTREPGLLPQGGAGLADGQRVDVDAEQAAVYHSSTESGVGGPGHFEPVPDLASRLDQEPAVSTGGVENRELREPGGVVLPGGQGTLDQGLDQRDRSEVGTAVAAGGLSRSEYQGESGVGQGNLADARGCVTDFPFE